MTWTPVAMGTFELPLHPAVVGQDPVSGQGLSVQTAGVAVTPAVSVSAGQEQTVEQQIPAGHNNRRSRLAPEL